MQGHPLTPPAPVAAPRPQRLSRRKRLLFALVPLFVLCGVGELLARGYRASRGVSPFSAASYRDLRIDLIRRSYPAAHDPELGYVPRPGFASADNQWHAMVTIDGDGMRENGAPRPTGDWVLAAGDSFTFGDQVGDADTWPAQLERALGRPVRNGGVFGYGFAQAVLRARRMLATQPARDLVLSFIPDDLVRCEESRRFTPIPWYDLQGDRLVLRGVPVPDTAVDNELDTQWGRKLLGHSALVDVLAWNVAPRWWVSQQPEVRVHPSGTGAVIAERLLDELVPECRARGVRLLVVLQGHWHDERSLAVLAHARALGAETLNLARNFAAAAAADPSLWQRYFAGHMTAAGNAWVAREIAAAMAAPCAADACPAGTIGHTRRGRDGRGQ